MSKLWGLTVRVSFADGKYLKVVKVRGTSMYSNTG